MRRDEARERRFRALFEEHAGAVARYAARRVDAGDVHDVVAEVFLVAWRRFEDVPADPLPWLLGTARGVVANRRRSAVRRRALGERIAAQVPETPHGAGNEIDERLLAAIAALPDAEREAFVLVAWDGLDPARAAVAAGCSAGAFRMRLHRARAQLKRDLATVAMEESR